MDVVMTTPYQQDIDRRGVRNVTALTDKRVTLDLDALHRLCEECLQGIEAMEDPVTQGAMRQVCGQCMDVRRQLPVLQELRQEYTAEVICC